MKAYFNHLLEQQKLKVQNLESQVQSAKLTYADALRNLERISDEIHQTRNKSVKIKQISLATMKERSTDSTESFLDDADIDSDEYKCLPKNFASHSGILNMNLEEVNGYKNVKLGNNISAISPSDISERSDVSEKIINPSIAPSHSSEWTEINLDVSSPEEDIPYKQLDRMEDKPKLVRQKTLPNPKIENEFSAIKSKLKLDSSISNWISRSCVKSEHDDLHDSKLFFFNYACKIIELYLFRNLQIVTYSYF